MDDSVEDQSAAEHAVVVDDNPLNLYYAGRILRGRGFNVTPAQGYFDALQALQEKNSTLLLADIRLPSASGIELARFAREKFPHVKVLLMTAYTDEELRAKELKIPVIRVPFGRRELVNQIQRLFM